MNNKEMKKIIAILEIAQAGIEQSRNKAEREDPDSATVHYLDGKFSTYESVLHFLKTGCTADFTLWCNTAQKILINDIKENRIKV